MSTKEFYKAAYSYCRLKRAAGYRVATMVAGARILAELDGTPETAVMLAAAVSLRMSEEIDWLAVKDGANRYGVGLSGNWRHNSR